MLINNRLIWKSGSTLKDLSKTVNDIFSGSQIIPAVAATDFLYIGSDLPFNHRHFQMDSAALNDQASAISAVEIWDGGGWRAAVDVIDQTSVGGKTLAQSGIISWTTDRNRSWSLYDTDLMRGSGLETLKIYQLYWVRITFSANLGVATTLKYMGHKFSNDLALGGLYPDLLRSNVMLAFKAGKTNWDDQHILAAEQIINDLRRKTVIWNRNQIFGWEEFMDCAVHKVAEFAYASFGKDYDTRRETAREYYDENLDKVINSAIDKNCDGRLEVEDKRPCYSRLVRG